MKIHFIIILLLIVVNYFNILAQVSTSKVYSYDKLGRVIHVKTTVSNSGGDYNLSTGYTYDDLGNRIAKADTGMPIITKQFTQLVYCAGDSIQVAFTVGSDATFLNGNIFSAQLSDENGNFPPTPKTIGKSSPSKTSGTIFAKLPPETVYGTKYRIRVVSTDWQYTGVDNLQDLKINDLPLTGFAGFTTVCLNTVVTYITSLIPGCTYKWTAEKGIKLTPDDRDTIQVRWDTAGIGLLKIEKLNTLTGCKNADSLEITVLALPIVKIVGKDSVCVKNVYEYTSLITTNMKFLWTQTGGTIIGKNDSSIVKIRWDSVGKGSINLSLEDSTTECKNSADTVITIHPLPVPKIWGNDTACNLSEQNYISDSTSGVTDKWTVIGGKIIDSIPPYQIKVQWDTAASGIIKLVQTITATGCNASVEKRVTVNPLPKPKIYGDTIVCALTDTTYTTDSVVGIHNLWEVIEGGKITSDDTLPKVRIHWDSLSNTGIIKLTQTNMATGCIASIINPIRINPLPTPKIYGDTIVCAQTDTVYRTDSIPGISNFWEVLEGGKIISDSVLPHTRILWNSSDKGIIRLTQTNKETGCIASIMDTIKINPLPHPKIYGDTIVCAQADTIYKTDSIVGISNFWEVLVGGKITNDSTLVQVRIRWDSVSNIGVIKLTQTNIATGCVASIIDSIRIDPLPYPKIYGDTIVCNQADTIYKTDSTVGIHNFWEVLEGGTITGNETSLQVRIHWESIGNKGIIRLTQTNKETGCIASIMDTIIINPLPNPKIYGDTIVCAQIDTIYKTDSIDGIRNFWEVLKGGIITSDSVLSFVRIHWDSVSKTGILRLTQTNNETRCVASITDTVRIDPIPKTKILGDAIVCEFKTYKYYPTNIKDNSSKWLWIDSLGNILGSDTKDTVLINWGSKGAYKLFLVQTNSLNCSNTDSIVINNKQQPKAEIKELISSSVCQDSIYLYSAPEGYTYRWEVKGGFPIEGKTSQKIKVKWGGTGSGSIKLVMAASVECMDSIEKQLIINALPHPVITEVALPCAKKDRIYTANSTNEITNEWFVDKNEGTIIGSDLEKEVHVLWKVIKGVLKLTQTNTKSGCVGSITNTIVINLPLQPSILDDSLACENRDHVYTSNSTQGITNEWYVIKNGYVSTASGNQVTIHWNSTDEGILRLIQTTVAGCKDTVFDTVKIHPLPSTNIIGNDSACANQEHIYTSNSDKGIISKWEVPSADGYIIGCSTCRQVIVHWNSSVREGTLKLTQTDSLTHCDSSIYKTVVILPLPQPEIHGDSVVCEFTPNSYYTSEISGVSNKWFVTSGGTIKGDNSKNIVLVDWKKENKDTLFLIQTNSFGCSDTAIKIIKVRPFPVADIYNIKSSCEYSLESYSAPEGYIYQWAVTGGGSIDGLTNQILNVKWGKAGIGSITLIMSASALCIDTIKKEVVINELPTLSPITGDTNVCMNTVGEYHSEISNNEDYTVIFKWSADEGEIIGSEIDNKVRIKWRSIGKKRLVLSLKNIHGCTDSSELIVDVLPAPKPEINGDTSVCINSVYPYKSNNDSNTSNLWSVSGGEILGYNTDKEINVRWYNLESGTIMLTQTRLDNGCTETTSKIVKINALPKPIIKGERIVCEGCQTEYSSNTTSGAHNKWSVEGGIIVGSDSSEQVVVTWGLAGTGTIKLIQKNQNDCSGFITDTIKIIKELFLKITENEGSPYIQVDFGSVGMGKYKLTLSNILGQNIWENVGTLTDKIMHVQISKFSLASGRYFILFKTESREKFEPIEIVK